MASNQSLNMDALVASRSMDLKLVASDVHIAVKLYVGQNTVNTNGDASFLLSMIQFHIRAKETLLQACSVRSTVKHS